MNEKTFCMIKPDAVEKGYMGQMIVLLEQSFKINQMVLATLLPETVVKLYAEHADQEFFNSLVEHTLSGPVVLLELEGTDAISRLRMLIGPTNPLAAPKTTLRGQFGSGTPANAVHGSDSAKSAKRELHLIFG